MRSVKCFKICRLGIAVAVGGALLSHEVRAQEPTPVRRSAVRHAIVNADSQTAAQKGNSSVSRADGWVYADATPGSPAESYSYAPSARGLGSFGAASSYRGSYPTGTRDGYYSFSNYGAGGYGLGGYGLARYGLGTYGQSTLGWGNFGSYWTFSGYAGYAESSSYNY